jgi:phage gp16-like protein
MIDQQKQKFIRLIHVAKRELGLDEDTYRAMLVNVTGMDSTKAMPLYKLEAVVKHLKQTGFKVRSKPQTRQLADDLQSKKIRALWLDMHDEGIVKNPSEAALAAYVKRLTGVDSLHWLSSEQASSVIETLKKWQKRMSQPKHKPTQQEA